MLAMIVMMSALVMMMMAVVGGWCFLVGCVFWLVVFFGWLCFLVGAMQSAPDKERLLCIFNFSPRQQVQGFTGVLQGNVFSSLKERDDALDLQGSHAAAPILLLNNSN